jgi:hypothetical protein
MKMQDVTALGRPLDPNYATNRAIALLAGLVVVGSGLARLWLAGDGLLEAALWGIGAGLAVFLAWALGRELDPDHDLSAFAGAGLTTMGLFFLPRPGLLALFWMLPAVRVVNRTTGLPARLLDSLLLLGLGAWLTWQQGWVYGLATAGAFLLDARLAPRLARQLFFAAVSAAAALVLPLLNGQGFQAERLTAPLFAATAAVAALMVVVIGTTRALEATGDETGEPLNPVRVRAGQALAAGTALLVAWWQGQAGIEALMPLWAALLGVALYRLGLLGAQRRA